MSERDIEPLDPDLCALLAHEQARPPPPAGELDAVLARAALTVGGGGAPPDATGGAPPATGGAPPPAAPFSALQAALAHPFALATAVLAIGGAAVLGGRALLAPLPEAARVAIVAAPPSQPDPAPSPPPAPTPAAEIPPDLELQEETTAPREPPRPAPRTSAVSSSASRDALLQEELQLIAEARAAVLRGQDERALVALRQHARRFPGGQLAAEREVLMRRALAADAGSNP